mmetsp:Transcript_55232/g.135523  ORF Transcript_55232/g.135523 Transcript_55232/m.135523 type:complete len:305 (+) Transcript_55232:725-1639(+)
MQLAPRRRPPGVLGHLGAHAGGRRGQGVVRSHGDPQLLEDVVPRGAVHDREQHHQGDGRGPHRRADRGAAHARTVRWPLGRGDGHRRAPHVVDRQDAARAALQHGLDEPQQCQAVHRAERRRLPDRGASVRNEGGQPHDRGVHVAGQSARGAAHRARVPRACHAAAARPARGAHDGALRAVCRRARLRVRRQHEPRVRAQLGGNQRAMRQERVPRHTRLGHAADATRQVLLQRQPASARMAPLWSQRAVLHALHVAHPALRRRRCAPPTVRGAVRRRRPQWRHRCARCRRRRTSSARARRRRRR